MQRFILIVSIGCLTAWFGCSPSKKPISAHRSMKEWVQNYQIKPTGNTTRYQVKLPPEAPELPEDIAQMLTVEGVQLGRWLFYDPLLSGDNTQSCSSCHIQKHSFSEPKQFSVGINGKKGTRNSMPLVNLAYNKNFFWDGRVNGLEDMVTHPIENVLEMNEDLDNVIAELKNHELYPMLFERAFDEDISVDTLSKAIAQFLTTLVSFDSDLDKIRRVEMGKMSAEKLPAHLRSKQVSQMPQNIKMIQAKCGSCHEQPMNGRENFFNIGLDENPVDKGLYEVTKADSDIGLFKTPDLRNVTATAPYMHDGRFQTLDQVVDFYSKGIHFNKNLAVMLRDGTEPLQMKFNKEEKKAVIEFLTLLTDNEFLNNPLFANPFEEDAVMKYE